MPTRQRTPQSRRDNTADPAWRVRPSTSSRAFMLGSTARLNANTPIRGLVIGRCVAGGRALASTKAGVVAFSTSGDADLGDDDGEPAIIFKAAACRRRSLPVAEAASFECRGHRVRLSPARSRPRRWSSSRGRRLCDGRPRLARCHSEAGDAAAIRLWCIQRREDACLEGHHACDACQHDPDPDKATGLCIRCRCWRTLSEVP
jgi:hypothetical protein